MKTVVWLEFAAIWNASNSLEEVVSKTGQTKAAAANLACRMRKLDWDIKKFSCAKTTPLLERFWSKVEKTESCWIWVGSKSVKGYGQIQRGPRKDARPLQAHRVSWQLAYGSDPGEMLVLHKCDNPSCVRPSHLFLGTPHDNSMDMRSKKRSRGQENQPFHAWYENQKAAKS